MKIRSDFVTNSSSSSFGALSIECKPLVAMLQQYKELVEEKGLGTFPPEYTISWNVDKSTVSWNWEEDGPSVSYVPHSIDELLSSLFQALQEDVEQSGDDVAPIGPLVRAVSECQEDLEAAVIRASWQNSNYGRGGDDESRYDQGSYSPETLQSIKQSIADEKGCSIDEVTDYDFNYYVSDFSSVNETSFGFDREQGKEEYSHSFYLL